MQRRSKQAKKSVLKETRDRDTQRNTNWLQVNLSNFTCAGLLVLSNLSIIGFCAIWGGESFPFEKQVVNEGVGVRYSREQQCGW